MEKIEFITNNSFFFSIIDWILLSIFHIDTAGESESYEKLYQVLFHHPHSSNFNLTIYACLVMAATSTRIDSKFNSQVES